ncbi:lamin tail domain-containing protein 1-like [Scleropages formosus]|uniref:lamin tail domain-containing protein 1-like n=1 Tax=Scleropages formosus TaxID=113540 RepID=UPI0010FAA2CE|nr:lamin tail domain-containing protein 1-like [Scleropages formosus]
MVWAEASQRPHIPPAQFLWRGMDHLGAEPWVTTILCQEDGQVVAWYTPALCTTESWQAWKRPHHHGSVQTRCQSSLLSRDQKMGKEARQYPFYTPPGGVTYSDRKDKRPFLLLKRKMQTTRMSCSPWTQDPCCLTHPAHIQPGKVDFRGLPNRNNWPLLCQSNPAPAKIIIGDQHGKTASSRRRPTRSAGPCLGGVMFVGPVSPLTSPLQRYCDANCYTSKICFSKLPNT